MIALNPQSIEDCQVNSLLYNHTGIATGILVDKRVVWDTGYNEIAFEYWVVDVLTVAGAYVAVELMEHSFFYKPSTLLP